ncbi:Gldg family protein [Rhodospirillaceae bacterium AH-315-P19]|nr:Gldg family protein [Rhodospirillaceae bacterium AH-315-P19]
MKHGLLTIGGVIIAAVLFFAINAITNVAWKTARFDFTEDKLYTLSPTTRTVMDNLDRKVALRLYYSKTMSDAVPEIRTYAKRVEELLEEYIARSNGLLSLEIIDPEPFTEKEDLALKDGVQGVPLDETGAQFFFGLYGVAGRDAKGEGGTADVIPFFQLGKEQFLEYDITQMIHSLGREKKPIVGVIGKLPLKHGAVTLAAVKRGKSKPYAILGEMQKFFDVRFIEDMREISGADLLLIVHPRGLSDRALYFIDQYVLRGGRALIFVDPFAEFGTPPTKFGELPSMTDRGSNLEKLFDTWGLQYDVNRFIGDRRNAETGTTGFEINQKANEEVVRYLPWFKLGMDNLNQKDPITSGLETIDFATAGALRLKAGATTTFTPLIVSSQDSMLIETKDLVGNLDPEKFLRDFKASGENFVLAARITGPVKTAFPNGPPAVVLPKAKEGATTAGEKDKKKPKMPTEEELEKWTYPPIGKSTQSINVIVVADTDMLHNNRWTLVGDFYGHQTHTPIASNGEFTINALENLSGTEDMISLRSRGTSYRPFIRLQRLAQDAEERYRSHAKELDDLIVAADMEVKNLQSQNVYEKESAKVVERLEMIKAINQQKFQARKEQRKVQRKLREDIDSLVGTLRFVNIAFMAILIGLLAFGVGIYRYFRHGTRWTAKKITASS